MWTLRCSSPPSIKLHTSQNMQSATRKLQKNQFNCTKGTVINIAIHKHQHSKPDLLTIGLPYSGTILVITFNGYQSTRHTHAVNSSHGQLVTHLTRHTVNSSHGCTLFALLWSILHNTHYTFCDVLWPARCKICHIGGVPVTWFGMAEHSLAMLKQQPHVFTIRNKRTTAKIYRRS